MKHKFSFLLIYGVMVLFGGLGVLLLFVGEKEPHPSQMENRMLAGFPTLSAETVKEPAPSLTASGSRLKSSIPNSC